MNISASAILVAARSHGETGVIARLLTREHGLVAGYVTGGRGRQMRPVMIPGNRVSLELRARSASQLPFARIELEKSCGPWLSEPLPAAAIQWACVLSSSTLPEHSPQADLYDALGALIDAICAAPSARGWLTAMITYETMILRELGYGGDEGAQLLDRNLDIEAQFETFRKLHAPLKRYLLADRARDVMSARVLLGERLARMVK